jgi:hypothetical protein
MEFQPRNGRHEGFQALPDPHDHPRDPPEVAMGSSLEAQAAALVNPKSGVANDYLNHFNEMWLLVENLPVLLPEMVDEILAWKPVSYREYFTNSPLPGKDEALKIYDGLDPKFRQDFEETVELLDKIVLASVALIMDHRLPDGTIDPDAVGETCERLSAEMRVVLDRAADLVNFGHAPPLERPQHMADRILAAQTHRP